MKSNLAACVKTARIANEIKMLMTQFAQLLLQTRASKVYKLLFSPFLYLHSITQAKRSNLNIIDICFKGLRGAGDPGAQCKPEWFCDSAAPPPRLHTVLQIHRVAAAFFCASFDRITAPVCRPCVFPGFAGASEHHLQPAPATGQQGARNGAQRVPSQEKWRVRFIKGRSKIRWSTVCLCS